MRLCIVTVVALSLVALCRCADEEYEYDEDPAPVPAAPVTPAPPKHTGRASLLSPRARSPIGRKPALLTTSTTEKPVEQVIDEQEDGEELEDENLEQEEVVTSTEPPKKIRAGIVRPFRSNEDLLAVLKRRRAQAGSNNSIRESHRTETAEPVTAKPKSISSNNSRSRTGQQASASTDNQTSSRSNRGRFGAGRAVAKPVQEEVEEETQQEVVQVKPKSFRRG